MKTHTPTQSLWTVMLFVIGVAYATARTVDDPSPTPTPCPRTLGDIKLKTGASADTDGRVVISDANLADLAARGTVTVGGQATSKPSRPNPRKTPSRTERQRWRKMVLDQKAVIVGLERKRLRIEAQIDLIENAKVTARTLARLQQAEIELRAVEREIRAEKAELGRLIRDARRHGAEPGWFR